MRLKDDIDMHVVAMHNMHVKLQTGRLTISYDERSPGVGFQPGKLDNITFSNRE